VIGTALELIVATAIIVFATFSILRALLPWKG
jgi:hypothetical protein